jgi:hypothetical protein
MKKIFLSLATVGSLLVAQAQETKISAKLTKGDKFLFTTKHVINNTSEMGGNEMKSTVDGSSNQEIEVVDVANGNYTLNVVNNGYTIKANSPMQGDIELSTVTGAGFDQLPGGMPKFLKEAAGAKYELVVSETGNLISAKGLEKLAKVDAGQLGMLKLILGGLELNVTDSNIIKHTLHLFTYCQKGSIKAGESWETSAGSKKEPQTNSFKAVGASATSLNIETKGTQKINSSMSMMGQDADVTGNSTSAGTVQVDIKTGLISTETTKINSKINISGGGMEIPSTNETTVTHTVEKK